MSEMPRYQCPRCKCVVEALIESPPTCSGPTQHDPQLGGDIQHVDTQMVRVDDASPTGDSHEDRIAYLEKMKDADDRFFKELERKVDSKAAAHEERLRELEGRDTTNTEQPDFAEPDGTHEKVDELEHRFASLERQLEVIKRAIHDDELRKRINKLDSRLDGHTQRIGALERWRLYEVSK